MKVWITKYALTRGIDESEAEICSSVSDEMIKVLAIRGTLTYDNYFHKPYWYSSREAAVMHANAMRAAKLASLKKKISKLEKLEF